MAANIPTTSRVPAYPTAQREMEFNHWGVMVSGFCNGSQTVVNNSNEGFNIYSIITGALVYTEGTLKVGNEYLSIIDMLPTKPLNNGQIWVVKENSTDLKVLAITAGSTEVDTTGLTSGTYTVKGFYLKEV